MSSSSAAVVSVPAGGSGGNGGNGGGRGGGQVATVRSRWEAVDAPVQERESALPEAQANAIWRKIYGLFNPGGGSSETEQDEVYLATLLYFVKNGCSPSGAYRREIRTASGLVRPAGEVVGLIGQLEGEIRQFLRAHEKKSIEALKYSPAAGRDMWLRAAAEKYGITEGRVYLLADWLRDSPFLVGDEVRVYENARVARIRDAAGRQVRAPVSEAGPTEVALPPVGSAGERGVATGLF